MSFKLGYDSALLLNHGMSASHFGLQGVSVAQTHKVEGCLSLPSTT